MKRLLKTIAVIITFIVLAAISYVAYVFITYHRIEDNLQLDVENVSSEIVQPGVIYTLTTFNVGYGAYSKDYSFFMDGGKYSRAYNKDEVIKNVTGSIGIISAIDPDFAFFQEVDTDSTRSYHVNQYTMLKEGFPGFSSVFAMNYDSPYLLYPVTDRYQRGLAYESSKIKKD
jgi:hypothetical protein